MDTVGVPGPLTRLRRRQGLVRSSLRRRTDHIEALVTVVVALLAVVVVPVAVMVALGSFQRGLADAAAASAQRTAVTAILEQDALPQYTPLGDHGGSPVVSAVARWQLANGQQGRGILRVSSGKRAGYRIPIWVDQTGQRVAPPLTSGTVFVSALMTGVDLTFLGWLVLGLLWWAVCRVLNRVNAVRWEIQWARTGPGGNHRTWR